ncbi:Mannan endo-1,6-alpha-mannosidase DCW1 [Rhodotorula toruloides]|nr:Mannan endo-1,6-alpha-mannosidase DCW1 [Rhodotorula toruloides]
MGNRRRVPLLLAASSLVLLLGTRSTLAIPSASPVESCPSTYDDPYLAFPHQPRHGHAFVPSDPGNPVHPLLQDIRLPENPTNPAPRPVTAKDRHQLYTPGRNNSFRTDEFRFQPGRRAKRDKDAKDEHGGVDKRAVVSSVDVPFPPSAWIDINDLSTIATLAQAAVARMQTWYENGVFEWTGWWQTPVLGMAYTNLDLALGNQVNELLIKDLLIRNDGLGWMIDKYIDDQSWWAMFALRAHQAYPNTTWLNMVETINNNNSLYWTDTCGGGVLWLTYKPMIKNTITNGLYFSILTRLYRYTGNSTHFDYAMNTLNWWLSWSFEPSNGRVYDTITADWQGQPMDQCTKTGEQTWTYNSGAFLFGLADLFYATGNTKVLDLARSIAYAAMRDFTDHQTGILTESCEHDPPPGPGKPPGCQQDETVFKGIFLLGLAELYVARPDPNIYNFVNTQLLSNAFNNLDDTWLFGMWWDGPWNVTTAGPKTQINALCLLSAAAMINADYLSAAGQKTAVPSVTDQIKVPESTATGEAGSTNRDGAVNGAGRASEWAGATAVVALAMVVGGVGVLWT